MPSPHDQLTALVDLAHHLGDAHTAATNALHELGARWRELDHAHSTYTATIEKTVAALDDLIEAQTDLMDGVHGLVADRPAPTPAPAAASPADIGWPPATPPSAAATAAATSEDTDPYAELTLPQFAALLKKARSDHPEVTNEIIRTTLADWNGKLDLIPTHQRKTFVERLYTAAGIGVPQ